MWRTVRSWRWSTWLLIAAHVPPAALAVSLLGDLAANWDCRVSTDPQCDPLLALAVLMELAVPVVQAGRMS